MKKKLLIFPFIFLTYFYVFNISKVIAIYDPLSVPNNKYGIHIVDENDLDNAAKLVNSSGGDWGYVTMVIRENDRIVEKWQNIFGRMQQLHLIPLIRLATNLEGDVWRKPKLSDVQNWADFLSQLNWITKNRYIILFNEPNHAKEWGGMIDPVEYSQILSSFSATLKAKSTDFFILPAGLDASAPNSNLTMSENTFLLKMKSDNPFIFDVIDGFVSHSYPNPGFVGNITDSGRGTLKTYLWELNLLKLMGVTRDLPIFIAETGWPHQDGQPYNKHFFSADEVAQFIKQATELVWNDPQIVALTPFILNYQSPPFSNFSWQKPNSGEFYPQYTTYQSIEKIRGEPLLVQTEDKNKILGTESKTLNSTKIPEEKSSPFLKIFNIIFKFISEFI
jgi:hypothetical protein